jgi:hypothetical protein
MWNHVTTRHNKFTLTIKLLGYLNNAHKRDKSTGTMLKLTRGMYTRPARQYKIKETPCSTERASTHTRAAASSSGWWRWWRWGVASRGGGGGGGKPSGSHPGKAHRQQRRACEKGPAEALKSNEEKSVPRDVPSFPSTRSS